MNSFIAHFFFFCLGNKEAWETSSGFKLQLCHRNDTNTGNSCFITICWGPRWPWWRSLHLKYVCAPEAAEECSQNQCSLGQKWVSLPRLGFVWKGCLDNQMILQGLLYHCLTLSTEKYLERETCLLLLSKRNIKYLHPFPVNEVIVLFCVKRAWSD